MSDFFLALVSFASAACAVCALGFAVHHDFQMKSRRRERDAEAE